MEPPSISIVIPAYNVESYVGAAIESVLQQTTAAYEILLFNDGSTDGTGDILATYAGYPNVRCITQSNHGLGPTRNLGAQFAMGDYLYFFDADDLLEHHFIERMQRLIVKDDGPDLVMFSGIAFSDDNELASYLVDYRRNVEVRGITGLEALPLLQSRGWIQSSACLYLLRTAFWRNHKFAFPSTLNEDEDVIIRLICSGNSVVITDEVFFHRRVRRNSITTEAPNDSHVLALECNLRQAIQDVSLVPRSAGGARKLLRKRCRIVATQYLALARKLGYPIRKDLLLRAVMKTGNGNLFRKAFRNP